MSNDTLREIAKHLAQHADAKIENSVVHYCLTLARSAVDAADGRHWRLTPAGTWVYVNEEGADIGHVYRTPGGAYRAEPWGRMIACFTSAEEGKRHVEGAFL